MTEQVEVWPEYWDAALLFASLRTQWRVSMAGATGIDYSVIPTVCRMKGLPRHAWPQLFDDIREMEDEALKTMAESREHK